MDKTNLEKLCQQTIEITTETALKIDTLEITIKTREIELRDTLIMSQTIVRQTTAILSKKITDLNHLIDMIARVIREVQISKIKDGIEIILNLQRNMKTSRSQPLAI